MSKHSIVRWIKIIGVYLLVAAVAALGWLWCALPEEVYLEPEQTLTLPRFGWVEPLRGHGSRNVASTRAAGSYQTTLALGGWLPVKTIRATVMQRPTVTVCGTPFGVKMFSEGALVVGFSEVHTAAGTINPAKQAGLRLGDRVIRMGNTVTETNEQVHAALEAAARGADLLCMDATYADDADLPKARLYGHTTCREAGALAAAAAVRRLWLTHYSAAVTDTAPGLAAARTAYPLALAGYDGMAQELEFDKE